MPDRTPPDITIVGAGLQQYAQLTLEAIAMLRRASLVFYSGFNGDIAPLTRRWNPDVTVIDLDAGEYGMGTYRPTMYERMATAVLDNAVRTPGVVVFQPGSAMVVDSVTDRILAGAGLRGLTVSVIAGISCIETVTATIGYDAGAGLQVVQAQQLLLHRHRLNRAMAAVIIQPGYYDTRWWAGITRSQPDRFAALQCALRDSYEPDTEMALVLIPLETGAQSSVFWFALGDLPALYRLMSPFHTLFIPPAMSLPVDDQFLRRIDSWDATVSAVEHDADGRPIVERFDHVWRSDAAEVPAALLAQDRDIARRWAARRYPSGRVPTRNSPTSPSS